ncbi:NADP-dependent oxidoreductase [Halieaceae bacterium IMCC14734]|uniref:NADP-dependent oxidoreductase n=1 Tax=Candidatus Litorirhabdus singularis TaxID=2518993 RepID=A0ABT3TJ18_9GAMM|nr:NADP-dependent oxidoreductase [Candidatus Litorirhabdus singularis]MCX2981766.1 NADP-dependent oxidoreductase [Candidatus Litorirhabdus singularis]
MFAMIIRETGGPEVFEYAELSTPAPGPGEVLVQVAYAGVNPADWKNRQGMLAAYRPYSFPYVIGFDAAGVVAAVGVGVQGLAIGDRVFTPTNHGQGGQGSYAEYTLADADRVARIPPGLALRDAAALPVAALTAWQGLFDRGGLQADQKVLVHGGSGGVGSFAVQFAQWCGARVAATCSSPNVEYLKSLGVERVIDYRTEDIAVAVQAWQPKGLDFLLDAVGVSTLPRAIDLVAEGGTLVSIPTLVDDGDAVAALAEAERRGITHHFSTMDDSHCASTLEKIAGLLVSGEIQLPPIKEFPLVDVAQAHELIEGGHNRGKIVLKVAALF